MKPSLLAIVPARANSKRIPGKNRKNFLGKPLIHWTLESALDCKKIDKIIVTTDDLDILDYQSKFKTIEFVRRPDELALDATPGVDPVLDLLIKQKQIYDYVVLLQPTSPLRTSEHISQAFQKITQSGRSQLVSVKKMSDTLGHIVYENGTKLEFLKKSLNVSELTEFKVLNGAIYISKWDVLLKEKTFLGSDVETYEMNEESSVDIDLPEDWKRAEMYAAHRVS